MKYENNTQKQHREDKENCPVICLQKSQSLFEEKEKIRSASSGYGEKKQCKDRPNFKTETRKIGKEKKIMKVVSAPP